MNLILTTHRYISLLCFCASLTCAAEQLPDPDTMISTLPLTRENYTPTEDVIRYNQRATSSHQCPMCHYMRDIRNPALVQWRAWDSLYLLVLKIVSEDES